MTQRKIALVHDWLTGMRGGEKVLEVLCDLFPSADLFTLIHVTGQLSPTIERHRIITSPLQKIPGVRGQYRYWLPLMPWAIERLDFSGYDLIISTSHCVAKGIRPPAGAVHWTYCHTPMRYIWDQYDHYFGPGRSNFLTRKVMSLVRPALQRWDIKSNARVDHFIANSANVAERIQRLYGRESVVICPPVDYDFYSTPVPRDPQAEPYDLVVSALVPYKRVDVAVQACTLKRRRLLVIGDGPELPKLKKMAGPTVVFQGWQSPEPLRKAYQGCRALLFPGEEDFGIVPLEAMSAGRPVLAFGKGGALETVVDGQTGLFFGEQSAASLSSALERLETMTFTPEIIQAHARLFSRQNCERKLRDLFVEYDGEMS